MSDICIIAIDPGTTNLGLACIRIDIKDYAIQSVTARTFTANTLLKNTLLEDLSVKTETARGRRIKLLCSAVSAELVAENPSIVVCESPFINTKMPEAYGALVETTAAIRNTVSEYRPITGLIFYEPLLVKKCVGAKDIQNKLSVKEGLRKLEEVSSRINLDELSEHAIDAIAVGYTFIIKQRQANTNPQ